MFSSTRALALLAVLLLVTLLASHDRNEAEAIVVRTEEAVRNSLQSSSFPQFRLPYWSSENGNIKWSGGPHGYNQGFRLDGTYPAGQGSGLDFAGGAFDVLAMAEGTVLDASCGNGTFGCQVAIRHDVDNSVMIYAHLEPSSIAHVQRELARVERAGVDLWAPQGAVLGKAGCSGLSSCVVHLHIEWRDGNDICSFNCPKTGTIWGNPIGWDDGLPLVDSYRIFGYRADGDGDTLYNYDGSAVQGNTKLINDFEYLDINENGVPHWEQAIATVDTSFECLPPVPGAIHSDCESRNNGSQWTKFAGKGIFLSNVERPTASELPNRQASMAVTAAGGDFLISTNQPVWLLGEPSPGVDNALFTNVESPPDDTVFAPGQAFRKTWRLRNTGTSTWGAGYQLVFTGGSRMGGPAAVSIPPAAPGQTVEVGVNLVAPNQGGTHRGDWRLRNPQGTYFGDNLWVQVRVPDGSAPPPASSDIELECTNCPVEVAPGSTFRPTIRATVNRGQLLESRGDMLRHKSGDSFGAWPHVAVTGSVGQGGTYNFTFYANDPIHAPSSDGTYRTTWQVWQNGRWAGEEFTIEFRVRSGGSGSNHRPNRPSLDSPVDWKVYYSGNTARLCARSNGDPDGDAVTHYYFQIYESAQNWNSGWTTSSCVTTSSLGPHGYQWRVKVRDARGLESEWSERTWHFTIVNPKLEITELYVENTDNPERLRIRACTEGQGGVGITMKVRVNSATDGSDRGEWRTLKELGVPCFNEDDAPTWRYLEYASGTHLIRAEAHGEHTSWDGATVREITYRIPTSSPPSPPRVTEPLWDSYVTSRTVQFSWGPVMRANSLRLQVATDPNYNTMVLDQQLAGGATSYTHIFAASYPILYGRVLAIGSYGTDEGSIRFRMDTEAPSSSMTALPATVSDAAFPVSWSGSDSRSGLRWYQVQVRDGDRIDSEWEDWYEHTTLTSDTFVGQPGHTYYFRVRAMDQVGHWEAWPDGEEGDTHTWVDSSAGTSGASDLAVVGLETYLLPDSGVVVQATFENQGDTATQNGFYTDLYVDHLPSGSGDYTGSLRFWVNDPVAAGERVVLTTLLDEADVLGHAGNLRQLLATAGEVTTTLYAQVDSAGVVREPDDDNNISDGVELCLATTDQYEGSDSDHTNAPYIDTNERQLHNFHRPGDEDWVRIYAWEGNTYVFHTYDLGSAADTYLYLYAEDGSTVLASNDDTGALASQLIWTAPNTGTYYLRIRQWNPNSGGCNTLYILALLPLQVTAGLTLEPADPMVGEPVTATITVESTAPGPVTLNRIGIAAHGPDCSDWGCGIPYDFPWQNDIIVEPGIPYTYQMQRVFTAQGPSYFAQMIYGLSETAWHPTGALTHFNVGPGLTADTNVTLLPAAPMAREPVAATYQIRNEGPRPLSLSALGLVARGPDCTTWECPWNDFPHNEDITLQPGQTYTYSGQRSFSEPGSGYFVEPGFADPNGWWFPVPDSVRVNFDVTPGIVLAEDLTLAPAEPQAGQIVTARFRLRNDSSRSVTLHRLGVGAKGPNCTDWDCPSYQDFPWLDELTLLPGQSYLYEGERTFSEAGGGYFAQVIFRFTETDWQHLGTLNHFSVATGIEVVEPVVLVPAQPLVDLPVTATYTVQNKGNRTITLPALGLAARGPGCAEWPCGAHNDFPVAENITLAAGESYMYSGTRSFSEAGSYQAQPEFADPNGWWTALSGAGRLAFNVQSGIQVLEDLTLVPAAPLAGETVTARFRLYNPTAQTLTLKQVGIGVQGPNCIDWDCARPHDFPWRHDVILSPGESYVYEEERTFADVGNGYFAQIMYGFGEEDRPHLGTVRLFSVGRGVEVVEPLSLSDEAPPVGMPITATFTIRNMGGRTIDLPYIRAIARGPSCADWECSNARDFPFVAHISLAPGEQYTYRQQLAFELTGEGYFAEPAYADSNGWWLPLPGSVEVPFVVTPGITVTHDLTLAPVSPVAGEMVTATFTVRNDASRTLSVQRLGVGVQGPECTDWSCNRAQDYRWLSNVILEPGESYTYREQRPFLVPGDYYFAQIIYGLGDSGWQNIGPRLNFAVQPGLTLAGGLTLTPGAPMIGESVTAAYTLRNDATRAIHIPAMGIVSRGPGCTHWECGPAFDFPHTENVQLAAGATYTYISSRTFDASGSYFAVPAFSDLKDGWYALPAAVQLSFSVGLGVELVEDLTLNPADPQVGEVVTGRFTLRNASNSPVTLSRLGISGRGPGCADWSCTSNYQDFPWDEEVTLQPGESITYAGKRLFNTVGDYFTLATYVTGEGDWYHGGSERRFTARPGLQVSEALTLSPTTPIAGEPVEARYALRNAGSRSITLSYVGLVARGPDCDTWGCSRVLDFPHEENIMLAPGSTFAFTATRSFPDPGSHYFAEPAYGDPNGWWYPLAGGERLSFEVLGERSFEVYLPLIGRPR